MGGESATFILREAWKSELLSRVPNCAVHKEYKIS